MAAGGDYGLFNFPKKIPKNCNANVLECRVCEDVFDLQGDKVPRLLLCGHTLCHSCLFHLPILDGTILCPFDRQPTHVGDSGVWSLKKNFALVELLERLQYSQDRPAVVFNASLEKEKKLAIRCDENEEHTAVLYCTICSTHLCIECSEKTHSTRTLAKHKQVPLSEKPRDKPKCTYHPTHFVEFVCLEDSCQSLPLMCFICKDYGRHLRHRHALIEGEAENVRSTILSTLQHIQKFCEEMNESACKIESVIHQMEGGGQQVVDPHGNPQPIQSTIEDARNRVCTYFHELRETLNRQETAALTVVDTYIREKLCSLKQQQEDITILLSQMWGVCVQCERILQQDDARVLLARQEVRSLLETVQKQQQQITDLPEQLQLDASIPITFTKDNRVHIGPKIEMRVVTLGLDDAGKTSILFKLKQNEFVPTIPTIGFNVETVEYKNLKFTIWDVGGQPKLRPLWKHYYLNTQAVIFVIDSSDLDRLEEAHSELAKLISEKELKDASLLILANKQDVSPSMSIEEITEKLSLFKLCCGRSWHIQACDAQSGTGLHDGLDWLSRQLVAAGVTDIA